MYFLHEEADSARRSCSPEATQQVQGRAGLQTQAAWLLVLPHCCLGSKTGHFPLLCLGLLCGENGWIYLWVSLSELMLRVPGRRPGARWSVRVSPGHRLKSPDMALTALSCDLGVLFSSTPSLRKVLCSGTHVPSTVVAGGSGFCSLMAACGLSLKVYFLASNEPLKVIKQKTERLSQRLLIGRSNIKVNIPKSISLQLLQSLSRRGLLPGGVEMPAQVPRHLGQPREGLTGRPPLPLYCGFLLFH